VAAEEEAAEWEVQRGIRLASKIRASVAGEEAATVAATTTSSSSSSRTNSTLSIAINARGGTFEVSVCGRKRRKEKPKGGNRKRMASSREGEAFVSVCLFSPALRHAPRSSQEEGNVAGLIKCENPRQKAHFMLSDLDENFKKNGKKKQEVAAAAAVEAEAASAFRPGHPPLPRTRPTTRIRS
jgi:hypothetical protein